MKISRIFLLIILVTNHVYSQLYNEDDRFTSSEYFSNTQIDSLKNITYGNAIDYLGELQALKMDFYFPKNNEDTLTFRPFILLIHGGGFRGGSRESMTYHCTEFAKRGFVVATMSYRLGFDKTLRGDNIKAVYRAQQDTNTAIEYLVSEADKLKIDPSGVFIGGSSAGAITSQFIAYASQAEWNQVMPQIESDLGPLNATEGVTIKGIYNNKGSVSPFALKQGELVSTISFHGGLDQVVPIDKSVVTGYGSREIHKLLTQAGVCNDLTIVPDGGHGIYKSYEGANFRINRVACFFKSLILDTCVDFLASEDIPAKCSN